MCVRSFAGSLSRKLTLFSCFSLSPPGQTLAWHPSPYIVNSMSQCYLPRSCCSIWSCFLGEDLLNVPTEDCRVEGPWSEISFRLKEGQLLGLTILIYKFFRCMQFISLFRSRRICLRYPTTTLKYHICTAADPLSFSKSSFNRAYVCRGKRKNGNVLLCWSLSRWNAGGRLARLGRIMLCWPMVLSEERT